MKKTILSLLLFTLVASPIENKTLIWSTGAAAVGCIGYGAYCLLQKKIITNKILNIEEDLKNRKRERKAIRNDLIAILSDASEYSGTRIKRDTKKSLHIEEYLVKHNFLKDYDDSCGTKVDAILKNSPNTKLFNPELYKKM